MLMDPITCNRNRFQKNRERERGVEKNDANETEIETETKGT